MAVATLAPHREWSQEIARQVLREHIRMHREQGNDGVASSIAYALGEIERVWGEIAYYPSFDDAPQPPETICNTRIGM